MKFRLRNNHNNTIVLHGGPGAIGSAAGLAQLIDCVEVYNEGQTLEAQFLEIQSVIDHFKMEEVCLIGHSWGAWLGYLYASKHAVSKLILIGCGAFEQGYLSQMTEKRHLKLTAEEQARVDVYFNQIAHGESMDLNDFGQLMDKMDSYAYVPEGSSLKAFDFKGHQMLMKELNSLRTSGQLLEQGKCISAEIIIIHGKDDPHPLKGITEPFKKMGYKYQLYVLEKCGHTPWHEKYAKEDFKTILKIVLNQSCHKNVM